MTDTGDFRIEASIFVVSFCLSVDVAISSTVKSKLLDWSERMSSVFVLGDLDNEKMFSVTEINTLFYIYDKMMGSNRRGMLLGWNKK